MAAAVVRAPVPPPTGHHQASPASSPPNTRGFEAPPPEVLANGSPEEQEFERLQQLEGLLGQLQTELRAAEACLEGVDANYRSVAGATDQIREQCAELVDRRDRLEERAERLREHLRSFEQLEEAARLLQGWRPGQAGLTPSLVQLGETLRSSLAYLHRTQWSGVSNDDFDDEDDVDDDDEDEDDLGHGAKQPNPQKQPQQVKQATGGVRGARDIGEYLNLGRSLLQRFCRLAESHFSFCLNSATEPALRKMERSLQLLVQQPDKYLPLDTSTVRRQLQAAQVTDAQSFLQARQVLTAFRPLLRQLPEPSRQQLAQVYRMRRRQQLQAACNLIFTQHSRLARLRLGHAAEEQPKAAASSSGSPSNTGNNAGHASTPAEEPSGLWNLPEALRSQAHALIQLCGREFQLHQDFFGSSADTETSLSSVSSASGLVSSAAATTGASPANGVAPGGTSGSPASVSSTNPDSSSSSSSNASANAANAPVPLIQQLSTAGLAIPESAAFDELLEEGLAGPFYHHCRPQIIQLQGLDLLCEVILVLRTELLDDQLLPRGRSVAVLAAGVQRLVQDTQQRLAYRAQIHIRDHIRGFPDVPAASDYPMRLFCPEHEQAQDQAVQPSLATGYRLAGPYRFRDQLLSVAQLQPQAAHGSGWHPVLRVTLLLLSQLYRCLEGPVFRLLAQQAVAECVQQLQRVAQDIQRRQSELQQAHKQQQAQQQQSQKQSQPSQPSQQPGVAVVSKLQQVFGPLPQQEQLPHALLFLLQHLLALRQQISPFRVDLSSTELQLDFSELLGSMSRVLLVRPSQWTTLFRRLIHSPSPAISERRSDSRQELEALLRHVCERLITGGAQLLVGDLVRVLDAGDEQQRLLLQRQAKPQPAQSAQPSSPGAANNANSGSQDFQERLAQARRVLEVLRQMASAGSRFQERLLALAHGMFLYLGDAASEHLLLAPVKQTILEALAQVPGRLGLDHAQQEQGNSNSDELKELEELRLQIVDAAERLRQLVTAA